MKAQWELLRGVIFFYWLSSVLFSSFTGNNWVLNELIEIHIEVYNSWTVISFIFITLLLKHHIGQSWSILICLFKAVEKLASSNPDTENTNIWIIIGVVIPLLMVIIIISILYWKLCRTDKLEFQPDAMTAIQQRQKVGPHCAPHTLMLLLLATSCLFYATNGLLLPTLCWEGRGMCCQIFIYASEVLKTLRWKLFLKLELEHSCCLFVF